MPMDLKEFRKRGYEMIDYCADYMDNVKSFPPLPNVSPGYLAEIIPKEAPMKGESWDKIMADIEPCILKGMCHWQHPNFHAYFPSGNSWASVMGGLFANATGVMCSTWNSCPAGTELEVIITDWLAKFMGLPSFFYSNFSNPKSKGGGFMQASASECIMLAMIIAREDAVRKMRKKFPDRSRHSILKSLIAYASYQSHSAVEKAGIIGKVTVRFINHGRVDAEDYSVKSEQLIEAVREDRAKGLIPFFFSSILGSTSLCSFDDIDDIGAVCQAHDIWLHVDSAYAGPAFSCVEMRNLLTGIEYASSYNTNCNKWMLVNFDCSILWVKNKFHLSDALSGESSRSRRAGSFVPDFKNFSIQSSRRLRAIKIYMVMRNYGMDGLRQYVRRHIDLAKIFQKFVSRDPRFEIVGKTWTGMCCFRLIGSNIINRTLLEAINTSRKIHMVPAAQEGRFFFRFAICAEWATKEDISYSWDVIYEYTRACIHAYMDESDEVKDKRGDRKEMEDLVLAQVKVDNKRKLSLPPEQLRLKEEYTNEAYQILLFIKNRRHSEDFIAKHDYVRRLSSIVDGYFDNNFESRMDLQDRHEDEIFIDESIVQDF